MGPIYSIKQKQPYFMEQVNFKKVISSLALLEFVPIVFKFFILDFELLWERKVVSGKQH